MYMPELPEVQTTVDGINSVAQNLTVTDVWTDYKSVLPMHTGTIKNPQYFSFFKKIVRGAHITHASRRAKNVLIHLSLSKPGTNKQSRDYTILVHMKMTGHFLYGKYTKTKNLKEVWRAPNNKYLRDPFNRHIRLVFSLSNNHHLVLSDMRKFAKVTLIPTKELYDSPHLSNIGPEPLDKHFTEKEFVQRLSLGRHKPIKTVLMDPNIIAGIGNIYSDEILWHSNIHPLTKTNKLSKNTLHLIFKATKNLLQKGILFGGDSMSDYRNIFGKPGSFQEKHKAYQKHGTPCLKVGCKGIIEKIKIGGRSTHFCPIHQKQT